MIYELSINIKPIIYHCLSYRYWSQLNINPNTIYIYIDILIYIYIPIYLYIFIYTIYSIVQCGIDFISPSARRRRARLLRRARRSWRRNALQPRRRRGPWRSRWRDGSGHVFFFYQGKGGIMWKTWEFTMKILWKMWKNDEQVGKKRILIQKKMVIPGKMWFSPLKNGGSGETLRILTTDNFTVYPENCYFYTDNDD